MGNITDIVIFIITSAITIGLSIFLFQVLKEKTGKAWAIVIGVFSGIFFWVVGTFAAYIVVIFLTVFSWVWVPLAIISLTVYFVFVILKHNENFKYKQRRKEREEQKNRINEQNNNTSSNLKNFKI